MSVIMDTFNEWFQSYDKWRKERLDEIKNPDYQRKRKIIEEGEQAGKPVKDITKELIIDNLVHGGEDVLKQITRIAVIITVALIGVLAMMQLLRG